VLGEYDHPNDAKNHQYLSSGTGRSLTVENGARYDTANPWFETLTEDSGLNISQYWHMLLKHRWVVLSCIVGALALGLAITLLTTPVYHAEITLKIDREPDRIVNSQDVAPRESMTSSEEFFQTQYGLIKSRALAASVVDRLGLSTSPHFLGIMGVKVPQSGPGSTMADRRRLAINSFQKNMTVTPVRGSRLVKIGFDSPDAALAATIANSVGDEFIQSNLTSRYNASGYARSFLEKMLVETKEKLEASERAVSDYATKEGIVNVQPTTENSTSSGTQSLAVNSLVALNNALATARGERIKAEQRYKQSVSADAASLPEVLQNPTIQQLNQTRGKLNADYAEKSKIYKENWPDLVSLRQRINEVDDQIKSSMRDVQASLKVNYDVALSQEKSFEAQVSKQQGATLDMGQRSIQYGILQREADTNRTLYDGLLQRYKEIGVTGGIASNNISVVDPAETPRIPAKPNPLLNMALAALVGLGLGVMAALIFELMDESIATPEDLQNKIGLPLLGSVPKLAKGQVPLDSLADPRSPFSEAYYSIRTALQFSTGQGAPSSMLITSSRPSEGKSTTALAIARNFASIGMKVLLVDGDMRNPSMHRHMGIENTRGLSNLLTGSMSVLEASHATDVPGLSFIPCGPLPPNPAELLASEQLQRFIAQATKDFGLVVIDGPPVMGLADAPALAAATAGTIFVVEARGTRRGLAKTAIQRLLLGRARLLGGVLTKFDAKRASYGYGAGYAYAYDYNYGAKPRLS
jgi:succinoglycan biosynthesis transport protein ExoP